MQITSFNAQITQNEQTTSPIKSLYTEKISQKDVKEIKESIAQSAKDMIEKSTLTQSSLSNDTKSDFTKAQDEFIKFLDDIGYTGQSLDEISQEKAKELVSEDGFFGVKQTSQRISDFVIDGAQENEELLRAGRDGILQGYNDVQEMWGSTLPDISQQTLDSTLENVDMYMNELGYSLVDTSV